MSYKKKYKSIFGAKDLITAPNYLAELIIKKRADKKGIKVPNRIWMKEFRNSLQHKYWHNAYMGELQWAYKILKDFDETCVIEALKHHECSLILSLKNKKLRIISEQLQQKKDLKEKYRENIKTRIAPTNKLPTRVVSKRKSKIGKLR